MISSRAPRAWACASDESKSVRACRRACVRAGGRACERSLVVRGFVALLVSSVGLSLFDFRYCVNCIHR